jgi:hypothetical protein
VEIMARDKSANKKILKKYIEKVKSKSDNKKIIDNLMYIK